MPGERFTGGMSSDMIESNGHPMDAGSLAMDRGFDAPSAPELEQKPRMTYKEWKKNGLSAQAGTIITGVPISKLFTPQDNLEPTKWVRASEAQARGEPDAFTVPAELRRHPVERVGIIPVLGEGNHRVVHAATHGRGRINIELMRGFSPNEANHIPVQSDPVQKVTNLVNRYGGAFDR